MMSGNPPSFDSKRPWEHWLSRRWAWLMGNAPQPSAIQDAPQRALYATIRKLGQVQRQMERLQSDHHTEMARLAQAYQTLSPQERAVLPPQLRAQLHRIAAIHNGAHPGPLEQHSLGEGNHNRPTQGI